jgi:cysteine synthase
MRDLQPGAAWWFIQFRVTDNREAHHLTAAEWAEEMRRLPKIT